MPSAMEFGKVDEPSRLGLSGLIRWVELTRLVLACGPLDEQPLLLSRGCSLSALAGHTEPERSEAAALAPTIPSDVEKVWGSPPD